MAWLVDREFERLLRAAYCVVNANVPDNLEPHRKIERMCKVVRGHFVRLMWT